MTDNEIKIHYWKGSYNKLWEPNMLRQRQGKSCQDEAYTDWLPKLCIYYCGFTLTHERKLTKWQRSTSETRDQRKTEADKKQKKNSRRRCRSHRQNLRDSRNRINYLIEKVIYKALIGLTGGTRIFFRAHKFVHIQD